MDINITAFFNTAAPMDYSASVAEIGANAGSDTWRAANDDSADFPLIDTDEKRDAWREFVKSSGGWSAEEVAAFTNQELNALFIQWVAGDMRECGMRPAMSDAEWLEIEARQQSGNAPGNIGRGDDGAVYFYIGV